MNLKEYLTQAETVERDGVAALEGAHDVAELEAARIAYLGDRQGRVKALQEALRSITKDEKPAAGKRFNEVRTRLEALHAERKATVDRAGAATSYDDLSLPGHRT